MKTKITHILLIVVVIVLGLTLSSCASNDIEIVYDLDTQNIYLTVPTTMLDSENKAISAKNQIVKVFINKDKAKISIPVQTFDTEDPTNIGLAKDELKKLLPTHADVVDNINFSVTRNYFGSSIAGTAYYTYNTSSTNDLAIPIRIISKTSFIFNGSVAEYNNNGGFSLNTTLNWNSTSQTYELEQKLFGVNNVHISLNVSAPSPSIKYIARHEYPDPQALKYELQAIGMNIEYIDGSQVIFYESYDTVNDFNGLASARLYALFGIVTEIHYEHAAFFTSSGNFNMTVYSSEPNVNVTLEVVGAPNTEFICVLGDKQQTSISSSIELTLEPGLNITAQYEIVRWFQTVTSFLVILAIGVCILLMLYVAKRH